MLYDWFRANIYSGSVNLGLSTQYIFVINVAAVFSAVMFILFIWSFFHLTTDVIMAFRAVFGFGYKKRKGGSH